MIVIMHYINIFFKVIIKIYRAQIPHENTIKYI